MIWKVTSCCIVFQGCLELADADQTTSHPIPPCAVYNNMGPRYNSDLPINFGRSQEGVGEEPYLQVGQLVCWVDLSNNP